MLFADLSDLFDGLDSADLIIGEHHRDETSVFFDGGFQFLRTDESVLMDRQQRHFTAFLFQFLQGVQNGMV